jgi:hypothetical protein
MLKSWLVDFICKNITVGGWCGLCGRWIGQGLFPSAWPYGVCDLCRNPTPHTVDGGQAGVQNGQVDLPTATNA